MLLLLLLVYTVYDGHEGSAVSELLSNQLHTAVKSAVEAAWGTRCTLLQNPTLQNSLTAAAQSINEGFLAAARRHKLQAGSSSNSTSGHGREWDGDDGSTAVFAVIAGKQVLVGNVGNSRAVLCTAAAASSSSSSSVSDKVGAVARFIDFPAVLNSSNGSSCSNCEDATYRSGRSNGSNGSGKCFSSSSSSSSRSSSKDSKALTAVSDKALADPATQLPAFQARRQVSSSSRSSTALTPKMPVGCSVAACATTTSTTSRQKELPLLPVQLSFDHTPSRQDEADRVVAAGGTVAAKRPGGKLRVAGELEVSRSFGDVGYVGKVRRQH
jgi:serine/threonine protein phosphatase PrpC